MIQIYVALTELQQLLSRTTNIWRCNRTKSPWGFVQLWSEVKKNCWNSRERAPASHTWRRQWTFGPVLEVIPPL